MTIGAIEVLSGPNSKYGVAIKNGFDLALDEVNARGGVSSGRPLAIDYEDSAGSKDQALDAARRMALALDVLNEALSGDLDAPLRIGIGLHAGPTIVGEMGYERATQLTAIGDTVNTASRLESLTKEFGVQLVVSQELLDRAGVPLADAPSHEVEIRGRHGRLAVRAVARADILTTLSS